MKIADSIALICPIIAGTPVMIQAATVAFQTANTTVVFDEAKSWTVLSLTRNGKGIISAPSSGQGTVIADPDWAGSVHGNEVVHSFSITVDGTPAAYSPNATYSGSSLAFTRSTTLATVLDLTSVMTVTDAGISETVTLTRISDEQITTAYGFLGSRDNRLTGYASYSLNGSLTDSGTTVANDGGNAHMNSGAIAVAQYDPALGDGLVSIIEQGAELGLHHFIWDRDFDNKLYAQMSLLQGAGTIGETWTIRQKIRYFDATLENWQAIAAALVPEPVSTALLLPFAGILLRRKDHQRN
ncbi:MAG: hypothetical protein IT447_01350 [Phycisphaerales bacterium]|nr:hypothetical protein [Phycisphaerales bacterium]